MFFSRTHGGDGGIETVGAVKKKKDLFFHAFYDNASIFSNANWENTWDLDYQDCKITHNSAERKGSRGGTDRALSVTRVCK